MVDEQFKLLLNQPLLKACQKSQRVGLYYNYLPCSCMAVARNCDMGSTKVSNGVTLLI